MIIQGWLQFDILSFISRVRFLNREKFKFIIKLKCICLYAIKYVNSKTHNFLYFLISVNVLTIKLGTQKKKKRLKPTKIYHTHKYIYIYIYIFSQDNIRNGCSPLGNKFFWAKNCNQRETIWSARVPWNTLVHRNAKIKDPRAIFSSSRTLKINK